MIPTVYLLDGSKITAFETSVNGIPVHDIRESANGSMIELYNYDNEPEMFCEIPMVKVKEMRGVKKG